MGRTRGDGETFIEASVEVLEEFSIIFCSIGGRMRTIHKNERANSFSGLSDESIHE